MRITRISLTLFVFSILIAVSTVPTYAIPMPCYKCNGRGACVFDAEECRHGGGECSSNADCGGSNGSSPAYGTVTGIVWEDLDNDRVVDRSQDRYWYRTGSSMSFDAYRCRAGGPYIYPWAGPINTRDSSILRISPGSLAFTCSTPSTTPGLLSAGYFMPMYRLTNLRADTVYMITLTPPENYNCADVQWRLLTCYDRTCGTSEDPSVRNGTGCGVPLKPDSARHDIRWKIVRSPATPTTVTGRIYETTNAGTCSNNGTIALPDLTAALYNGAVAGDSAAVSSSDGSYTIATQSNDVFNSLCINGTISSPTAAYELACVSASSSSGGAYTCTQGSGACAINCTPTNVLSTNSSVTINLGFTRLENQKWISVLDGDIYAPSILSYVATTPLGGFTSNLVNTLDGTSVGGFGFAGNTINTQTTGSNVSEKGGAGEGLNVGTTNFEDNWFNKFTFTAPTGATTTPPSGNTFVAGRVYNLTVSQFNTLLATGTYSISASNESLAETAIVYVTADTGTISISNAFTTDNPNLQNLVLITNRPVNISSTVTNPVATFATTSPSRIDLNIISSADISTNSAGSGADDPIMINGTLVSRSKVNLRRNLGALNNSNYPAEVVKFYPHLGNLIRKYELNNTSIFGYTGLGVFDVQFDYAK